MLDVVAGLIFTAGIGVGAWGREPVEVAILSVGVLCYIMARVL